jgi:hypothetical protein
VSKCDLTETAVAARLLSRRAAGNAGNGSVGQAVQKFDDRGADLCGALLLGPMATAGEHLDVAQGRHVLFHVGNMLGCSRKRNDQVVILSNVEGGHGNLDAFKGRHQLPTAVDIAIVAERPANTASREFTGIDLPRPANSGTGLSRIADSSSVDSVNSPHIRENSQRNRQNPKSEAEIETGRVLQHNPPINGHRQSSRSGPLRAVR